MKKLFTAENRLFVFHIKNLLEMQHLKVQVKNEFAGGGVGDLAPLDTWLELWVDDKELLRAEPLLKTLLSDIKQQSHTEKKCPNCSELNAQHFKICWSCGLVFEV